MSNLLKYIAGLGLIIALAAWCAEKEYDFSGPDCVKHDWHDGKYVGPHCMSEDEIRKEIYGGK